LQQGAVVGPDTGRILKSLLGSSNVAVQGIDYPALLSTNFLPGGADLGGIATMRNLLTRAASECPNSKLLAGGYSQGAALTHRAIENLPQSVKDRIVGVVTFGDTQNLQDRGQIVSLHDISFEFSATLPLPCTFALLRKINGC
jgi:cutinase